MVDVYRAVRQFERMFDSRYNSSYALPAEPVNSENSQLIAVTYYDHEKEEITVESKV